MRPSTERAAPCGRERYLAFRTIGTRWMDNDVYGHVNNVVFYSWFDTAVNAHLIEHGALDPLSSGAIGLVIETQCNYFAPFSFPQTIEAGIGVSHIGESSVRYEIGLFGPGASACAARGHFVHVYVDPVSRRPRPLPPRLRRVVEALRSTA
jgi:acyl-CoA thioester hydrolase